MSLKHFRRHRDEAPERGQSVEDGEIPKMQAGEQRGALEELDLASLTPREDFKPAAAKFTVNLYHKPTSGVRSRIL